MTNYEHFHDTNFYLHFWRQMALIKARLDMETKLSSQDQKDALYFTGQLHQKKSKLSKEATEVQRSGEE